MQKEGDFVSHSSYASDSKSGSSLIETEEQASDSDRDKADDTSSSDSADGTFR